MILYIKSYCNVSIVSYDISITRNDLNLSKMFIYIEDSTIVATVPSVNI